MYRFYSSMPVFGEEKDCPRVTIVGEHKDGVLKIAVAKCSPKDRFTRKMGRSIAETRLKEGKHIMEIYIPKCDSKIFHEFATAVLTMTWDYGFVEREKK